MNAETQEQHKAAMERAWFILKNNSRMQEEQRKMAYDLTMCPQSKTRQYWKKYAASISAIISTELVEIEQ